MLIDSHCHLVEKLYKKPPEELISDAKKAQVETLITVGNNLKDSAQNIELAEKHENVYATVGIYPHEDQDKTLEELRAGLENLISPLLNKSLTPFKLLRLKYLFPRAKGPQKTPIMSHPFNNILFVIFPL